MKNIMFLVVGLLSATQVMADPIFRPYATCVSQSKQLNIKIMQNTDAKDKTAAPFVFTIDYDVRGSTTTMTDQGAVKVDLGDKRVLEMFQSFELAPYHFSLMISSTPTLDEGTFKGLFADSHVAMVVMCSHDITFDN